MYGAIFPRKQAKSSKVSTGDSFFFAPLCPYLISRYGFYQGDVDYRVEPKEAIDFFYGTEQPH